ncbi:MAG TPA: PQQ-binding-like beta-propeller repeat protein [Gemmatimonadaceae bacterium]|nr:PQQ-binding-like beta-propeller repeat protein [Gemmatimonadaceae bacterium]
MPPAARFRLLTRAALLALPLSLATCRDSAGPGRLGQVVWRVPGHGWAVVPSVDATTAYYGGFEHQIVAIEKATGRVRWTRSTGLPGLYTNGHNTVLAASVVAVGDVDVYAFDRATGERRWVFRPANDDQPGYGWLASDGATIYADSPEGRVYAIDAATGAQRWATDLSGGRAETGTLHPTLKDGVVYVGVYRNGFDATGALVALDAATGAVRWTHEFTPELPRQYSRCWGGAAFHGDKVIVASEDGRVFALRAATGEVAWVAPRVHEVPGPSLIDARPLAVGGDTATAATGPRPRSTATGSMRRRATASTHCGGAEPSARRTVRR